MTTPGVLQQMDTHLAQQKKEILKNYCYQTFVQLSSNTRIIIKRIKRCMRICLWRTRGSPTSSSWRLLKTVKDFTQKENSGYLQLYFRSNIYRILIKNNFATKQNKYRDSHLNLPRMVFPLPIVDFSDWWNDNKNNNG